MIIICIKGYGIGKLAMGVDIGHVEAIGFVKKSQLQLY